MKKLLCFIFILILISCSCFSTFAINYECQYDSVYDNANLLTDEEEKSLSQIAQTYKDKFYVNVVFLTYDDAEGKSTMTYTDDFYDKLHYNESGVLFAIDMDNREMYINTVGSCIDDFTDAEREIVFDNNEHYVFNKQYYSYFDNVCQDTFQKIETDSPVSSNSSTNHWAIPTLTSIIVSIISMAIATVILIARHNKANKQISATNYSTVYHVNDRKQNFVRTYQTVSHGYYRQSSSSGGGGGSSSHRSSGGVRHGGGGRGF